MEYLKKHNEEDFEIMSEEDYSNYEEALCDLTRQLGLECYTLNEMEEELLSIIEYIRRPKRISGSKFNSASKAKKNSVYNSYKPIEKCRMALIDIIKAMPEEQSKQMIDNFGKQIEDTVGGMLSQSAITAVRTEYTAIGMDTDKNQSSYK